MDFGTISAWFWSTFDTARGFGGVFERFMGGFFRSLIFNEKRGLRVELSLYPCDPLKKLNTECLDGSVWLNAEKLHYHRRVYPKNNVNWFFLDIT